MATQEEKEQQLREAAEKEFPYLSDNAIVKNNTDNYRNVFVKGAKSEAAKAYHQQAVVNLYELRNEFYESEWDGNLTPVEKFDKFILPHIKTK